MVIVNMSQAEAALTDHVKAADVISFLGTLPSQEPVRQQEAEGTIRRQNGVLGL